MKKQSKVPFPIRNPRNSQVSLLDHQNKFYDSISEIDAFNLAKYNNLDLVCFREKSNDKLAFFKIIDFGKWKYSEEKRKKQEQNKNKHTMKEMRFSYDIDAGDIGHKIKKVEEFLDAGDEVLLSMRLKGRQKAFQKEAVEKMEEIVKSCGNIEILSKKTGGQINFKIKRSK